MITMVSLGGICHLTPLPFFNLATSTSEIYSERLSRAQQCSAERATRPPPTPGLTCLTPSRGWLLTALTRCCCRYPHSCPHLVLYL